MYMQSKFVNILPAFKGIEKKAKAIEKANAKLNSIVLVNSCIDVDNNKVNILEETLINFVSNLQQYSLLTVCKKHMNKNIIHKYFIAIFIRVYSC